jgi:N-acetylglucosaminyl-diphospho-decaprenol L-rhamnosyltransferase
VLVDDGSLDGTAEAVRAAAPDVRVLRLHPGRGVCAARTEGVLRAGTPYVAFADDDSWWDDGALPAAADVLDGHPRLAVVAARILVGRDGRLDPVSAAMARSPLPADDLPGPRVLGFVACGAVVRRDAYLEVGGFPPRYVIGGEEAALALALAAAGWDLAHVPSVVARHEPHDGGVRPGRARRVVRNDLWTTWRHRRGTGLLTATARDLRRARSGAQVAGVADALLGLPHVLRDRRPVGAAVEAQRRLLDRAG